MSLSFACLVMGEVKGSESAFISVSRATAAVCVIAMDDADILKAVSDKA